MKLGRYRIFLLLAIAVFPLSGSLVFTGASADSVHPVGAAHPEVTPVTAGNGGTRPNNLQTVFNPSASPSASSYGTVNVYDANGLLYTPLVSPPPTTPAMDVSGMDFVVPSTIDFSPELQARFGPIPSHTPAGPPLPAFSGGGNNGIGVIATPEPVSSVLLALGLLPIAYLGRRWRYRLG
ncbi:MAG: hypothetical protein ACRD8O_10710 [Bryobacteraceae bacterium]